MEIEVTRWVEEKEIVNARYIRVRVPVDYGEEDMPNNYPHRKDDAWDVLIDVETGQIQDWPAGTPPRALCMKVADGGSYYLLDADKKVLATIDDGYVPCCLSDEDNDYLEFSIDANGRIDSWDACPFVLADDFFSGDD